LTVVPLKDSLLFAGVALLMVLTPGPNMLYLLSRSICQGRNAGTISLLGIISGLAVHVLAASAGLTAIFMAIPVAYDLLKFVGAAYLLYLAWQVLRPGARSPFEPRALPVDPPRRLYMMGFLTCFLNPKVAVLYLSIFPQFISPARGPVFLQGLQLGLTQMLISFSVNFGVVLSAAWLAAQLSRSPRWVAAQRYVMGGVLAGIALRLATATHASAGDLSRT
jgi:threonine/homoserine/homoserine lactone efflux protein